MSEEYWKLWEQHRRASTIEEAQFIFEKIQARDEYKLSIANQLNYKQFKRIIDENGLPRITSKFEAYDKPV